jgi:hypothetical protein
MASNEIEVLDPAATVEKIKRIASGRALNRRHFLTALGMTSAAAGAGLLSGCNATTFNTATGIQQSDILNFALNLEFLEATFYSYITTGADLPFAVTSGSGAITGAPSAKLTFTGTNAAQITDMLNEIYYDEINHVTALQGVLGSAVVSRPAINLAALGTITATNALGIARLFEDVGATAYAGALTLLSATNLQYATQILAVEGFHAGALRLVSIQNPTIAAYIQADSLDVKPFDEGSGPAAAAGPTASGGFFATAGAATATSSVPLGFAFTRAAGAVLSIAYGGGSTSGGFFPSGVNGLINSTSTTA